MLIVEALRALCKKATAKDATGQEISGILNEMAENWPTGVTSQAATTRTLGVVKQGAAVADAAGETPTKEEFNALLASLRAAGIIANS